MFSPQETGQKFSRASFWDRAKTRGALLVESWAKSQLRDTTPQSHYPQISRRVLVAAGTSLAVAGAGAAVYAAYQAENERDIIILPYGDKPYATEELYIFNLVPDLELKISHSAFRNIANHRGINILQPPNKAPRVVVITEDNPPLDLESGPVGRFFQNDYRKKVISATPLQNILLRALKEPSRQSNTAEIDRQLSLVIFESLRNGTSSFNMTAGISPEMTQEGKSIIVANPPIKISKINPERIAQARAPQTPEVYDPDEKLVGPEFYQGFDGGVIYNRHPDLTVSVSRPKLNIVYNTISDMKPPKGEKIVFALQPAVTKEQNETLDLIFKTQIAPTLIGKTFGPDTPFIVISLPVDMFIEEINKKFQYPPHSSVIYLDLEKYLNVRIAGSLREIATKGKPPKGFSGLELDILEGNKFIQVVHITPRVQFPIRPQEGR